MPPPTSAERGREARQRLLTAAAELIGELGWAAVSTRLVAERAGVRPGVVHYHFTSVQALLTEAALGVMRRMLAEVGPVLRSSRPVPEGVDALLSGLDGYTGTDPTSLVFVETYLAATRDEALRAALAELVGGFRRELAGWLGQAGHADADGTAALLVAALDGFVLHKALDAGLRAGTIRAAVHRMAGEARS